MATVTASRLTKAIGARTLFSGVSFKLVRGERMTLSGRNGTGKTTLLRMLAGEIAPDEGAISMPGGTRVALHDQRPPRGSATLSEYVLSGLDWISEIEAELASLESRMADGGADETTLTAYADAQTRHEHAGGYRWRERALATVAGLGIDAGDLGRPLESFSGGELTRASLARALATRPDLLLLDEPTNHLDIESLEWLEGYLTELDAAVVLVAHDRWFLESVGTSVLELEGGKARYFAGPWHAWREERAARELAAGRDVVKRQAEIARMERFVERFRYKATKARQAQSRVKMIEKLRRDGARAAADEAASERTLSFSFDSGERSGRVVLELEDATLAVGDRTLIADSEMWLERGEHVCLVGANGTGKTTLVEALARNRELDAGKLKIGHKVELGYLPQHSEMPAEEGLTVLAHAQRSTGLSEAKTRGLLGRLPVLGRGGLEAGGLDLGWRGAAAVAGDPGRLGRQPADPRRADQPPRRRKPRSARGRPAALRRDPAADLARPRATGGGGEPDGDPRRRPAAQPPRRMGGVPRVGAPARADGPVAPGGARQPLTRQGTEQEQGRADRQARARGRGGRSPARRARGRAGRPVSLVRSRALGRVDARARERQAGRRPSLRGVGERGRPGLTAGAPRGAPSSREPRP